MIKQSQCKICGNWYPYNVVYFVKRVPGLKNVCCNCEPVARMYINTNSMKKNKQKAMERDCFKCTECGCTENLHVHHIRKVKDGGSSEVDNLITLCCRCHANKHIKDESYHLLRKLCKD